jgi:hypothetical protein
LAIALPIFLFSSAAQAGGRETKERQARKACLSGDYAKGVAILSDLFVDTKDPTYVFNQGRCFEQNRRYEDAIARFQEYLRSPAKLSAADRATADQHITDCQNLLAKPTPAPLGPAPVTAEPAKPEPNPTPISTAAGRESEGTVSGVAVPPDTGKGLRRAGLVTAVVGGAGLVAGLVFNLKANSLAHTLEQPTSYTRSDASSRSTYVTLGWTAYGVGAACVATGAVLYYLGLRSAHENEGSVALLPAVGPDQVGAVMKGAF